MAKLEKCKNCGHNKGMVVKGKCVVPITKEGKLCDCTNYESSPYGKYEEKIKLVIEQLNRLGRVEVSGFDDVKDFNLRTFEHELRNRLKGIRLEVVIKEQVPEGEPRYLEITLKNRIGFDTR